MKLRQDSGGTALGRRCATVRSIHRVLPTRVGALVVDEASSQSTAAVLGVQAGDYVTGPIGDVRDHVPRLSGTEIPQPPPLYCRLKDESVTSSCDSAGTLGAVSCPQASPSHPA